LANAGDLLGSTTITDITGSSNPPSSSHKPLGSGHFDSLLEENPRTQEEFEAFSQKVYNMIIKPHINKPLYAGFVETHVRQLCEPLKDSEVRKAASGLTTLASVKLQEARDKASGKKKPKAAVAVGGVKGPTKCILPRLGHDLYTDPSVRHDTTYYDEALDDFGNDPDDFM
jgi:translation initiation factor 3 subunit J